MQKSEKENITEQIGYSHGCGSKILIHLILKLNERWRGFVNTVYFESENTKFMLMYVFVKIRKKNKTS